MPASELHAFERFCSHLLLEDGRRMTFEPFQAAMLRDYFEGTTETLILIPKKNGKTTLLAALGLFHLITTPDAECVVAAASRDQATIMYDQAAGFVRRTPGLLDRIDVKRGYREMRARRDSGRLRVLAADVDTVDGVIPTLALIDELHRQRHAGLYGIFRDGLGPRQGRMVAISTAGNSEGTPLGQMRAEARKLPVQHKDGRHTHARSADGAYAMHEWALEPGDDTSDMAVVKLANPASWQSVESLRLRHASPSMLPSQWARFACGLWMAGESWWLNAEQWRAAQRDGERLRAGDRITLGFDGSRHYDATALVACRVSDGLLCPLAVWQAPEDATDWEVPGGQVDAVIAETMERYRVVRGYFDPPLWQSEIDAWAHAYGEAVVRFDTRRAAMLAAVERFRTDLTSGALTHCGDTTLSRHALNAQVREVRGGYWLCKDRTTSPNKIDAVVAAVLAYEARADALASDVAHRSRRLLTL